jgi:DNA-binding CsgD family transcriptional regulator
MSKNARAVARVRYVCESGLRSEVVIPLLFEQIREVVRFGNWVFAWANSTGELVNSAFAPLRAESLDFLANHFDRMVRDCGFSPMDAVSSFPSVSNPRRTGRLNPNLIETESYAKVWGPEGCYFCLTVVIKDGSEAPLGYIQLFRPHEDVDFTPADEVALSGLLPYFRRLLSGDSVREVAGPLIQDGAAGVVVFADEPTPQFVSDRALALAVMAFNGAIPVTAARIEVVDPTLSLQAMHAEVRKQIAAPGSSASVTRTLSNERGNFSFEWEASLREGAWHLSVVIRRRVPAHLQLVSLPDDAQLSVRQLEVCRGLLDEEPLAEIARRIGVTPSTLKDYTREIYRKLGVTDRESLTRKLIGLSHADSHR